MWVKDAVQVTLTLVAFCVISEISDVTKTAEAHVQPSRDLNNRYLKLTPTTDRVRLAYTVYIGEEPGRMKRARLDSDHDGLLSDDEAEVYRDRIAKGVGDTLSISLNGAPYPLQWSQTYIGLGSPTTDAGSFSVDLIAWVCLPPGKKHQLVLRDGFRIERPGETEVRIESSPDVKVSRASLGAQGPSLMEMKWFGGPGPAATDGIHLSFQINSPRPTRLEPDDPCAGHFSSPREAGQADLAGTGTTTKTAKRPLHWAVGVSIAFLVLLLILALLWRARYRNTNG